VGELPVDRVQRTILERLHMAHEQVATSDADEPPSPDEPPPAHTLVLIVHNLGIDVDGTDIARMKEAEDEVVDVARHVARVLEDRGYRTETLPLIDDTAPLRERIARGDVSIVFNLVESLGGDAAREPEIPMLLVEHGVPFTGNSAPALKRALEKDCVREALVACAVPVAPALVVTETHRLPAEAALRLEFPLFVKPARVDGSIGIDQGSVVADYTALAARVHLLLQTFGGAVLVEEYLPGPELNVAVCPDAHSGVYAPTLLDFSGFKDGQWPVVTYAAKWDESHDDYNCRSIALTDQLAPDVKDEVVATARAALLAIGADGYARVDTRLDRHGKPFVIDVNPNPALHPEAGFALGLATMGIDFATLVEGVVRHGLKREVNRASSRSAPDRSRAARGAPVEGR
jgi:D-alanine-D-alanine ligase